MTVRIIFRRLLSGLVRRMLGKAREVTVTSVHVADARHSILSGRLWLARRVLGETGEITVTSVGSHAPLSLIAGPITAMVVSGGLVVILRLFLALRSADRVDLIEILGLIHARDLLGRVRGVSHELPWVG
ncbi:hypothetical protein [Deinococcus yavapaiensis]|uniref:hypothetical protein n=1 Tax=Deinococcus yavapaiensis TaxID=309889 RepID=UPI0011B38958|nr:hypothetical protein [Deinococcus yavapaiensis]